MYKAITLDELFSRNKYTFDSNHRDIESWINAQSHTLKSSMTELHAYNRVVSLFDLDKLSALENFKFIS